MHTPALLGALCLGLAGQTLASPLDVNFQPEYHEIEQRQTATTCNEPVHLIVGGGNDRSPGMQNVNSLLQSLVDSINSTYPGTTEYLPPYDGTSTPGPAAQEEMEQAVMNYATSCPDVPIVMIGYSFGGVIMMDTLCGGISSDYNANIIAAVAYGEETRVADQPYNTGSCTTSSPGTYAQPRADPSTCDPYAAKIQSYCLSTDPYCCTTGTDKATHFDYPQYYDSDALDFVMQQYNARQSGAIRIR